MGQRHRKLRMLRAHSLIQKVPKTHRYQVTEHGRLVITAILKMDRASLALLNKAAA
jgi:6-phosphogluconolactonase (cycloisomerase 2 family)